MSSLITVRDPRSPAAEAYRTLRTNLQFSSIDRPLRTLLVTSSGPDEGKTTLLANLAVTFAQTERSVIIVDCDLRRPALHTLFDLANTQGLSQVLGGATTALPLQATAVEGLRILTSGPAADRPADLISSRRMDALIEQLSAQADLVIFDAPPIGAVTDAAVLATKVDGVVLAAKAGKTRRDRAREAVQTLKNVRAHVFGVVLTDARVERDELTY